MYNIKHDSNSDAWEGSLENESCIKNAAELVLKGAFPGVLIGVVSYVLHTLPYRQSTPHFYSSPESAGFEGETEDEGGGEFGSFRGGERYL